MQTAALDTGAVARFAAAKLGADRDVTLRIQPLRGGLESVAVACVHASVQKTDGPAHSTTFVVKRLDGAAAREATTYATVLNAARLSLAPRYLGSDQVAPDVTYLYLEHVRRTTKWPWRDSAYSARVLSQLASVHQTVSATATISPLQWAYEAELYAAAEATVAVFDQVTRRGSLVGLRANGPVLRRTTAALAGMRKTLLEAGGFSPSLVHGDVHSGNVIVTGEHAILVDWGRARVGSPLEDVSSWLQSLGYWEPAAKQQHDTLFRHYLAAQGLPTVLGRQLRDCYWIAAACNALAGALRYHLLTAANSDHPQARAKAANAAADLLRIIRRADAVWRG